MYKSKLPPIPLFLVCAHLGPHLDPLSIFQKDRGRCQAQGWEPGGLAVPHGGLPPVTCHTSPCLVWRLGFLSYLGLFLVDQLLPHCRHLAEQGPLALSHLFSTLCSTGLCLPAYFVKNEICISFSHSSCFIYLLLLLLVGG